MICRPLITALTVLAAVSLASHPRALGQTAGAVRPIAMTLYVDATDAPKKMLHARMSMPATPGPMSLFYPKWIPGEHMPSGPIANLTGLHIFADDKELEWRRDLVEANAFA